MQPGPDNASISFSLHHCSRRRNIISLAPLIDVVFILLVFFMLASSFMEWNTLSLDTPVLNNDTVTETKPIVISVQGDRLLLDDQDITVSTALSIAAKRESQEQIINIQPLGETSVQQLIRVMDQLSAAGITPLRMVEDPNWNRQISNQSGDALEN
ncbi:MAG: biopolymer transporter ExbD [Pseudomonadota bacterium]